MIQLTKEELKECIKQAYEEGFEDARELIVNSDFDVDNSWEWSNSIYVVDEIGEVIE